MYCSEKKIFFHPTYFFLKFLMSSIFFHFLIFLLILSYLLYFILFFSSLYNLLFLFNVVESAGRSFERAGATHKRGEKISLLIFFSYGYFLLLVLTFLSFFLNFSSRWRLRFLENFLKVLGWRIFENMKR